MRFYLVIFHKYPINFIENLSMKIAFSTLTTHFCRNIFKQI